MCFSAAASFATAALTGAAGLAALQRTRDRREWPLATMPLLFAAQQAVEGALWLTLSPHDNGPVCMALTDTFLVFALVFWPLYVPVAALAIETEPRRRMAITGCGLIGLAVSAYLASVLLGGTSEALLRQGHIVYETNPPPDPVIGIFYLVAVGLSLALSSHRAVRLLSVIVVTGDVVAWFAYWEAFVSVWCFFAAAASVVILLHFEETRITAAAKKHSA